MTSGCHLCEEAQRVIYQALGVTATEVEIAVDERLLARYGLSIPVLQRTDTGAELGWPFGPDAVRYLCATTL